MGKDRKVTTMQAKTRTHKSRFRVRCHFQSTHALLDRSSLAARRAEARGSGGPRPCFADARKRCDHRDCGSTPTRIWRLAAGFPHSDTPMIPSSARRGVRPVNSESRDGAMIGDVVFPGQAEHSFTMLGFPSAMRDTRLVSLWKVPGSALRNGF